MKKIQKNKQNKKLKKCPKCQLEIEEKSFSSHLETHASQVFDWLFIGGYFNATNKKELENLNIKYILNCAEECQNVFEKSEGNIIKYKKLPIKDLLSFNIKEYLNEGIDFLKEVRDNYEKNINNGCVLVHCQLGRSRSSSIVIAYLIKELLMETNKAYLFLKKKRPSIMPNLAFMSQLRKFEKEVEKESENSENKNSENK